MLVLDKAKVKKILTEELGYDPIDADLFLKDYPPIHNELIEAVQRWLQDRTVVDVKISGVSVSEVMQASGCNFLVAIRDMDRLLDPGLSEERRRQMAESLRQPVYQW